MDICDRLWKNRTNGCNVTFFSSNDEATSATMMQRRSNDEATMKQRWSNDDATVEQR